MKGGGLSVGLPGRLLLRRGLPRFLMLREG